jgi:Domain of unknown function (DUF397)
MTLVPEPGLTWRKSSFSGAGQGGCVEVAWRKSSFSGGGNGGCVEVAWPAPLVAVRDSKHPTGPTLSFPRARWSGFLRITR